MGTGRQQREGRRCGEEDGKRRRGMWRKAAAAAPAEEEKDAAPVTGCWIRFPRLRGCMSLRAKVDSSASARGGGKKCSRSPASSYLFACLLSSSTSCCSRRRRRGISFSRLPVLPASVHGCHLPGNSARNLPHGGGESRACFLTASFRDKSRW
jgi:hypothetical protein